MTTVQSILTIAAVILGTMATRFLPFLIFPTNRTPPKLVRYLGKVLPYSVMGLLIVYSLKNVSVFSGSHGLPELISIAAIVALHTWRRNMLISIAGGTVLYMLLIQLVFA